MDGRDAFLLESTVLHAYDGNRRIAPEPSPAGRDCFKERKQLGVLPPFRRTLPVSTHTDEKERPRIGAGKSSSQVFSDCFAAQGIG